MYDISGMHGDAALQAIERDWPHLTSDLHLTDNPAYIFDRGKPVVAVPGLGFAVPEPGHPEEATCSGPSINCRRRFRTVDRINKRQVYRGYRVTEVVNSFPEHSNNPIPHKAYHHCAVRTTKILYWEHTTQDWQAQS
jgi:hypothetical protein